MCLRVVSFRLSAGATGCHCCGPLTSCFAGAKWLLDCLLQQEDEAGCEWREEVRSGALLVLTVVVFIRARFGHRWKEYSVLAARRVVNAVLDVVSAWMLGAVLPDASAVPELVEVDDACCQVDEADLGAYGLRSGGSRASGSRPLLPIRDFARALRKPCSPRVYHGSQSPLSSVRSESSFSSRSDALQPIAEDVESQTIFQEDATGSSELRSARSARPGQLLQCINEEMSLLALDASTGCSTQDFSGKLWAQTEHLWKEEEQPLAQKSVRSEASQQILMELQMQVLRLRTPRSASTERSMRTLGSRDCRRLIVELQARVLELHTEKAEVASQMQLQAEAMQKLQLHCESRLVLMRSAYEAQVRANEEQTRELSEQARKIDELTELLRSLVVHLPAEA
mmetsp:Transcript_85892/g.199679  ORF Transcript_85892/g.199679 Transcript_85892/m.199679 type:complete len:397 (-) Transcript_85892:194-1384(-)